MLNLDEYKKEVKEVKIGGKVYELSPPSLDDMIVVADIEKMDTGEQLNVLKGFLGGCGLPEDITGKLDGDQIKALSEHLQEDSKKK